MRARWLSIAVGTDDGRVRVAPRPALSASCRALQVPHRPANTVPVSTAPNMRRRGHMGTGTISARATGTTAIDDQDPNSRVTAKAEADADALAPLKPSASPS